MGVVILRIHHQVFQICHKSNHQQSPFKENFLNRWVGSPRQTSAAISSARRQSSCLAHQIQVQYQIQVCTVPDIQVCTVPDPGTAPDPGAGWNILKRFSWFWHNFVVQLSWHTGQATGLGGKLSNCDDCELEVEIVNYWKLLKIVENFENFENVNCELEVEISY